MKTIAKIFKNCPYADDRDMLCEECPKYRACCLDREERKDEFLALELKQKEAKLKKEKKISIAKKVVRVIIYVLLICIVGTSIGWAVITTTSKAEISAYGPSKSYYYHLSYKEKVMLAKLVFAESGFEPFEGQVAVAAVVLNRYSSDIPYFDTESVAAIIKEPGQFASIENITMEMLEDNPRCMEAVEAACKGWDPTRIKFPKGALYFYAPDLMPDDFQKGVEVLKIGNVNFHYDYVLYSAS